MKKSNSILKIMLKDHGKIIKLLDDFESSAGEGSQKRTDSYNAFKWELERHFLTEETAIFTSYEPEDDENYKMVPKLLNEHKAIKELVGSLEESLASPGGIDISELKNVLKQHKKFEEESFYPVLDTELDSARKNSIIEKINEKMFY
ncbi:MAG: hemerythrin domain-containing protein [Thermoplasmata archaeon]|nr:MAG: hemerythrin domain-containing protein [Thermoplasmata archaeon]